VFTPVRFEGRYHVLGKKKPILYGDGIASRLLAQIGRCDLPTKVMASMQGSHMAFVKFPLELFELRDVTAMAVMLRIIMRMDSDGNGVCFETRTSMCEHLGIDKNTWKKKLEFLEGQGLIVVAKHSNAPHHITLTAKMKGYLGVKNHPLTII